MTTPTFSGNTSKLSQNKPEEKRQRTMYIVQKIRKSQKNELDEQISQEGPMLLDGYRTKLISVSELDRLRRTLPTLSPKELSAKLDSNR